MKIKKKIFKILVPTLSVLAISAICIPTIISCSSVANDTNKNTNSSNNSSTSNDIPSSAINKNGALSQDSQYTNGSLTKISSSWQNTLDNSSDIVLVQSDTGKVSLKNNFPTNSVVEWYITNDDTCLVSTSLLLNTTTVTNNDGTASITIPQNIINRMTQFTYYVFAIVSNKDAKYPVQTSTAILNLSNSYPISITDGWLTNASGTKAICENTSITLSVPAVQNATYQWTRINHATNTTTQLASSTNTLVYPTESVGYVSIQCNITINKQTTTSTLNFYVSDFGTLSITNNNLVNNILTITDDSQTLGLSLNNSFIPSNTKITYQWYKKGVSSATYNESLLFTPTTNNTTSYALNDLIPTYNYDFKVIATFEYQNNVYNIDSNIVHVYYSSDMGSISLPTSSSNDGTYILNNNESVTLTLNTSKVNQTELPYLLYQWQQLVNGNWVNIDNATSESYTFTETNSTINELRVAASLPQNWNAGTIYSNIITIKTPAISTELQTEIYNKAVAYFENSSDFSDMWISYFTNSDNSNYWWFWQTLTAGWWKCGGHFAYKDGSNYVAITDENVLSYLKIASVSLINGSFSNGSVSGNPRLVFNMQPLTSNVYIYTSKGEVNLPQNETFAFSSPIYIGNVDSYADDYSFSVASNGSFQYTINVYGVNSGNQTDMKYYWNSGANSAWGLNFNSSIMTQLDEINFFDYQTTNKYTVLYNWIDNPNSAIYINNSTTPALPNFYNQVLNADISINANPSQTSSSTKTISFNAGTLALSVNPTLSNSGTATFTYKWQEQKSGSIEWVNINNTTNSYTLTYPSTSLTSGYVILYKVTITATYDNQTYTTSETFYVNWLPTDASTNTD